MQNFIKLRYQGPLFVIWRSDVLLLSHVVVSLHLYSLKVKEIFWICSMITAYFSVPSKRRGDLNNGMSLSLKI